MPKKLPRDEPRVLEPPTPSYHIPRILALKHKLQTHCQPLVGQRLDKDNFRRLVVTLRRNFPNKGKDIDEDIIVKSVRGLAGTLLSKKELSAVAWRLAGNIRRLRNCSPVLPWGQQLRPEWVPAQVTKATLRWTKAKRLGATFHLQFMAGSPCPLAITQFWTHGFCSMFSKQLGFTSSWGQMPYRDPRQLVNLRLFVKVVPELCETQPGFHEVKAPSGCVRWNRQLLSMRYRLNPAMFVCPAGYPVEHPCYLCPVGMNDCDASVHPLTFKQRRCPRCRNEQAWFDPASQRKICVDCFHTLRRKGEL